MNDDIEGRPVGEYPQVNSLITGVFNNTPPQPKYNFIRDVQLVLDYLEKELPNNSSFSDKLLTFKVTMLLALKSQCYCFEVSTQSKKSSYFRYQVYCENFVKACFQIPQTT